jgi:hypothetical protein
MPAGTCFRRKAGALGSRAGVLEEELSHEAINQQPGLPSTRARGGRGVEQFMRSLDPVVARELDDQPSHIATLPVIVSPLEKSAGTTMDGLDLPFFMASMGPP